MKCEDNEQPLTEFSQSAFNLAAGTKQATSKNKQVKRRLH